MQYLLVTRRIQLCRIASRYAAAHREGVAGERVLIAGRLWPNQLVRPCTVPKQVCLLKRAIGAVHQRSLGSIGSSDETSQLRRGPLARRIAAHEKNWVE